MLDHAPVVLAAMLDSSNFSLYANDFSVIWQSFDFPTDIILGGQNLSSGYKLVSSMSTSDQSSGRFYLQMQKDGNLVGQPVNSSVESNDGYWLSTTPNSGFNVQLILSHIGILVLNGGDQCTHFGKQHLSQQEQDCYPSCNT